MPEIEIAAPRGADELAAIKTLFTEYAGSLGFSLAYQDFESELSGLPGQYAPPGGALLLARVDGSAVGVVALRALEPGVCEMKRLYVRPEFRGLRTRDRLSLGRALVEGIVKEARALGHRRMRLDTIGGQMAAAIRLYRSIGFVEIPAYYPSPVPGTVYFELLL